MASFITALKRMIEKWPGKKVIVGGDLNRMISRLESITSITEKLRSLGLEGAGGSAPRITKHELHEPCLIFDLSGGSLLSESVMATRPRILVKGKTHDPHHPQLARKLPSCLRSGLCSDLGFCSGLGPGSRLDS